MESNEIFGVAEAALGRVRSDVEALQSEVSLRQQLLRRRKRALAGKERALERTRKAWEAADQEVEQAEEETAAKLTEIAGGRDGSLQDRGRRRRSSGDRETPADARQSDWPPRNEEPTRVESPPHRRNERSDEDGDSEPQRGMAQLSDHMPEQASGGG